MLIFVVSFKRSERVLHARILSARSLDPRHIGLYYVLLSESLPAEELRIVTDWGGAISLRTKDSSSASFIIHHHGSSMKSNTTLRLRIEYRTDTVQECQDSTDYNGLAAELQQGKMGNEGAQVGYVYSPQCLTYTCIRLHTRASDRVRDAETDISVRADEFVISGPIRVACRHSVLT